MNKKANVHIFSQQDGILPNIYIPGAVWSGNEKLNCFNVKTILTFFTKTILFIILFGGTQGISYDQIAPGI